MTNQQKNSMSKAPQKYLRQYCNLTVLTADVADVIDC